MSVSLLEQQQQQGGTEEGGKGFARKPSSTYGGLLLSPSFSHDARYLRRPERCDTRDPYIPGLYRKQ